MVTHEATRSRGHEPSHGTAGSRIAHVFSTTPQVPLEVLERLSKLEGKVTKPRAMEHDLRQQLKLHNVGQSIGGKTERARIARVQSVSPLVPQLLTPSAALTTFRKGQLGGRSDTVTQHAIFISVRHFVKWEMEPQFEAWLDEVEAEMSR